MRRSKATYYPERLGSDTKRPNHLGKQGGPAQEGVALLATQVIVGYLLTIIYAEYEQRIQKMIAKRAGRSGGDLHLQSFIRTFFAKRGIGRIWISDLGDTLSKFGAACRKGFMDEVENQTPHAAWDRITRNGHGIAHETGATITFEELYSSYIESHTVLLAFGRAIGLTTAEMKEFS